MVSIITAQSASRLIPSDTARALFILNSPHTWGRSLHRGDAVDEDKL